jgi:hypothetical protein
MWGIKDISFEIVNDMTDDPVVTLAVRTPSGVVIFVAEPTMRGAVLSLHGTHVQNASPNALGMANLMIIAQALMQRMGLDGLVVEGAIRTTGANPGRRPRVLRFTRRLRPSAAD